MIRVVAFVHVLNEKDLATENDAQEASECMRGAAWWVSIKRELTVVLYGVGRASLLLTLVAMDDVGAFLH